jgi:hypothetical protein
MAQFITLILNVCYLKVVNLKHGKGNWGGDNGDTQDGGRNYQVHINFWGRWKSAWRNPRKLSRCKPSTYFFALNESKVPTSCEAQQ